MCSDNDTHYTIILNVYTLSVGLYAMMAQIMSIKIPGANIIFTISVYCTMLLLSFPDGLFDNYLDSIKVISVRNET